VLLHGEWVEENVLAFVPYRQYVFTLPRLVCHIFARRRRWLGELYRIAERLLSRSFAGEGEASMNILPVRCKSDARAAASSAPPPVRRLGEQGSRLN